VDAARTGALPSRGSGRALGALADPGVSHLEDTDYLLVAIATGVVLQLLLDH